MVDPINIRIIVAENSDLVRIGLRSLFRNYAVITPVAETNCLEDLLNLTALHKPDVILVDLQMDGSNCAEYISKLLSVSPRTKILASAYDCDNNLYLQAYRSGVSGIINKGHSCQLLLKAIHAVHAGQIWFDLHYIAQLTQQEQLIPDLSLAMQTCVADSLNSKLSNSERRIASLACKGFSAKEISKQHLITEGTVRNLLSAIYKKTGVKKQIELCLKAPLYNYFQ